MKLSAFLIVLFAPLFFFQTMMSAEANGASVTYSFDDEKAKDSFVATVTGGAKKRKGAAKIYNGQLLLLESWWKSTASVAFPALSGKLHRKVEASWTLRMNTGSEGFGFLLLNAKVNGEGESPQPEKWEEPSQAGAFGIGFDASNPVNRDPFRGSGNTYDRPQHELSIHWDGMEIFKKTTPKDFRDDKNHQVHLAIEFVVGGALITIRIDEDKVYDEFFIAEMAPYRMRPAFGARNSEIAGDILLDDLSFECREECKKAEKALSVLAIDKKLNDKNNPKHDAVVQFPADSSAYGRIILTLELAKPETRFDPWDRLAGIYVYDDAGEKHEIVRYITPYHKGHIWKVDVTSFRPLLEGKKKVEVFCSTQGEGWVVSVDFDFYPGAADRYAYKLIKLWSGSPEIGNPEKPVADFYKQHNISLDSSCMGAEIRTVVTGHGMAPNTGNAAEFMSIGRELHVNGKSFRNQLWKTDNYLNPCRPQGGTWKYDRAGWAPGDIVAPWIIDLTYLVKKSKELKLSYHLDPYVNEARGKTWAPFHKTEAYLVLFKKRAEK